MSSRMSEATVDGEVMASVDVTGGVERLVIADISADESWLSIPEDAAASVLKWR